MVWGNLPAANRIPPSLQEPPERKTLLQYLFRDGKLPKGWGFYVRGDRTRAFTARSDVGFEATVDIRDGILLRTEASIAS